MPFATAVRRRPPPPAMSKAIYGRAAEAFARLADQVAGIVAGGAEWRRAESSIDGAVAGAEGKGREAASAMREVSGHFVDAIDESIKTPPYAALAIVAGIAFLFGATWRR